MTITQDNHGRIATLRHDYRQLIASIVFAGKRCHLKIFHQVPYLTITDGFGEGEKTEGVVEYSTIQLFTAPEMTYIVSLTQLFIHRLRLRGLCSDTCCYSHV